MSLTEFVKQEEVRNRISDEYPNQGDRASEPLKAEWQSENYTLVGTAFDYLLRFWLEKEVTEAHTEPWVARNGIQKAQMMDADVDRLEDILETAKVRHEEYLDTGELTDSLIKSSLDLARLDWIYRSGKLPQNLGEYNGDDVEDLRRLTEIVAESDDISGEEAYLNPNFGDASQIVGGADADVILDGTLIDIKTTKKPTFGADYWRQLVGYLLLTDIQRTYYQAERKGGLPEIEEFGVYFARHGELSTVSADVIYENENYEEFRQWFNETATEYSNREYPTGII